jgi:hypothetical protein
MKTIIPLRSPRQHGSVLVVGLIIATILGVTLASYLVLTVSQQRSVVRSQTWSASLALSESGVEEALAFMNKYSGSFTDLTKWTNNPGAEGWDVAGNVYHVKRTVDSVVGSYDVYVTNLVSGPMIVFI